MDFLELVRRRYSARAYSPEPVEEEKLQTVLEAARLAPTASNAQPFRIILIHTKGREADMKRIYHREWFCQAPLVICVCAVINEAWVRTVDQKNYAYVDAAIVMDHIVLAAASVNLGTCWIAAFNPEEARTVLGLPKDVEAVAFSPLGYVKDVARPKERRPLDQLVRYERW